MCDFCDILAAGKGLVIIATFEVRDSFVADFGAFFFIHFAASENITLA